MTENPNAMIPLTDMPLNKYDDAFDKLETSIFLPRLQLMTRNAKLVIDDKAKVNAYALVAGQSLTQLEKEVDVYVFDWRPKAIDTGADELLICYDPKFDEESNATGIFKDIQIRSAEKDSGCMWGYEFLVYISAVSKFATFYMGTISSRKEAPNLKAILSKWNEDSENNNPSATLRSQSLSSKKYTWQTPQITMCQSPLEQPDQDQLRTVIEQFRNPPESQIELDKDAGSESRDR